MIAGDNENKIIHNTVTMGKFNYLIWIVLKLLHAFVNKLQNWNLYLNYKIIMKKEFIYLSELNDGRK